MFNRRDPAARTEPSKNKPDMDTSSGRRSGLALIGESIRIEGTISGEEDLLIQGEVQGKVELEANRLTIGPKGRIFADVIANSVCIEGQMDGHLVVHNELVILGTARIKGNITAPRVSLEDGARFNGTIKMNPVAEQQAEPLTASRQKPPETDRDMRAESDSGASANFDSGDKDLLHSVDNGKQREDS